MGNKRPTSESSTMFKIGLTQDANSNTSRRSSGPAARDLGRGCGALHRAGACLAILAIALAVSFEPAQAQDLLRRVSGQQQQQQQQQPQQNNFLANLQLPPQLASLTPQQLHQLAQIRELQLQQEANARQQRQENAPAPIGLEPSSASAAPTAQPASSRSSGQIPQPNGPDTTPTSNERHDDGSYNESGSEMEGVAMSAGGPSGGSSSNNSPQQAATSTGENQSGGDQANSNSVGAAAPSFEVNWNKCPQLEPSESEKNKKTQVITKCLQSAPIPSNLTRENVEAHREQIATCALKVEGWFDEQGQYKYDKAENEIRAKRLEPAIEMQVLKFHVACKDEASQKFPRDQNKLIDQVQFYQACMDYYISIVCEIEVSVDQ